LALFRKEKRKEGPSKKRKKWILTTEDKFPPSNTDPRTPGRSRAYVGKILGGEKGGREGAAKGKR